MSDSSLVNVFLCLFHSFYFLLLYLKYSSYQNEDFHIGQCIGQVAIEENWLDTGRVS